MQHAVAMRLARGVCGEKMVPSPYLRESNHVKSVLGWWPESIRSLKLLAAVEDAGYRGEFAPPAEANDWQLAWLIAQTTQLNDMKRWEALLLKNWSVTPSAKVMYCGSESYEM
eukprot:Sspe_Gene.23366::Locus_9074_Transcript_1_1_Confidence_1.000_Length_633::g.23366::m.23366